jgi:hypothetical protein
MNNFFPMSEKTKAFAAMAQKLRAPNFWLLIVTVAGGLLSGCSYSYVADTQSKVVLHIPSKTSHSSLKALICFKHPVPGSASLLSVFSRRSLFGFDVTVRHAGLQLGSHHYVAATTWKHSAETPEACFSARDRHSEILCRTK